MAAITAEQITEFGARLLENKRSAATVEKYTRDIRTFAEWLGEKELSSETLNAYKNYLTEIRTIGGANSALSTLNTYFEFAGVEIRLKRLKVDSGVLPPKKKELTRAEYERLLSIADSVGDEKGKMFLMTLCSTGIRITELKFVTVEAVRNGFLELTTNGKTRLMPLPTKTRELLSQYAKSRSIAQGLIFITRTGKPVEGATVGQKLKKLCEYAGVDSDAVNPHNLRKLFARCFYEQDKDLGVLADLLGHSNLNSTREFVSPTMDNVRRSLESLGLTG